MLKHSIIYFSLLFAGQHLFAQQELKGQNNKIVNWGFTAGLNALSNASYQVYFNDISLKKQSVTSDIGLSTSLFARINLDNFFIQPEVGLQVFKEKLSFDISPELGNNNGHHVLEVSYYSANTGGYVGYHIVKSGPYTFNFYAGSTFKYSLLTKYNLRNNSQFKDFPHRFRISITSGFSLSISNIFLDFRYELNQYDSNIDFDGIQNLPLSLQGTKIYKKENILNFSCGLMF